MLQKWKHIIRNWINCYSAESNQDERSVNLESLLNIITHLHENLNLDESKSSLLEARTVEEFVLEKYPEFKFENATVEVSNEEEVYLVASLLLFFVCVNSKDVDIKSAMCSKLSGDDQETILKFSKSLLECAPITRRDVEAAITEACGLEMASGLVTVAETPPALRSLHGEVRRLQAALDAERFDRNYLQEELARTNLRMDKLSKDKEQYKLEIVNLKAKISMCCGQEHDSRGAEAEAESQGKLLRQLQDMEERLVRTQEMLDDAVYERDTYKAKVEELKQDRDKWLSLSQQESGRAAQLAEELEVERRHMHSLKELVAELRQHNRRNGLDSSLLECDDPDASLHSLQHNLSVCSEACANVVEVQLSEERAKVEALKQELQRLQDEFDKKSVNDKLSYERELSERENDIFNLKHRINEEIEEKNNLKSYYDNEMTKLNNEINELEQKIKDNNDYSRVMIEKKMQEIQTLQEEKLSLLQSLSNETTKMENIIAGLKAELATEKQARINMRDSYENQMMKLNEKVLNRNNELVELQNCVFEKGEMIETLQMDLRNEKEISNKYHLNVRQLHEQKREVESKLHDKNEEMTAMQLSLEHNIASVLKEIEHFKLLASSLQDQCRDLEQSKAQLEAEINNQTTRFGELLKDAENLKNSYSEELEKLKFDVDEKNAIISTLQTHLHDEIHHKIGYQEELQKLQTNKLYMSEEFNKLTVEFSKQKIELTGKERTIESLELCLKEAKDTIEKLQANNDQLNVKVAKLSDEINLKNKNIELLSSSLETTQKSLEDELSDKIAITEKLTDVTAKKQALQNKVDSMLTEKANLDHDLAEKCKIISDLQAESKKMTKTIDEKKKAIRALDQNMTKEKHKYVALEKTYDSEMTKLMGKINETEKTIKELSCSSKKTIKNKEHQIEILNKEIEILKTDKENMSVVHKEKVALEQRLNEEISFKNKIEKEYQNQCKQLDNITSQMNEEISTKNNEIISLKKELELAMKTIEGKCKEIRSLGEKLSKEDQLIRDLAHQKTVEAKDFQKKINKLQSANTELENKVKKEYECKKQAIEAWRKENEQLHFAMEEDNSSHEVLLKEKDCIIDRLEGQLKVNNEQLESIRKDYEDITLSWESYKVETKRNIEAKEEQIKQLTQDLVTLQDNLSEVQNESAKLIKKLEVMAKEMKDSETKNREEVDRLKEIIAQEEIKSDATLKEIEILQNQLMEEKATRDSLQTEKKQQNEELKSLLEDKNKLLNETIELSQRLVEEKTIKKLFEEERNALVSEKTTLERKLLKQVTVTESLLEDKECLTQQLVEEKAARDLAEKEKENIIFEKQLVEQSLAEVENNKEETSIQNDQLLAMLEEVKREKTQLLQEMTAQQKSNEMLLKEDEIQIAYLNIEIENLQAELQAQKTVQDGLLTDKESLLAEKEGLVKTLDVEKSVHDEKETEKDKMITKLCELNETYITKANNVQEELVKVTQNMKSLQMDVKRQEELNNQIKTTLNEGLEKLVQEMKMKETSNEILQKILGSDHEDTDAKDKCEILINVARTVFTEMETRQELEKALELSNSSLEEMKNVLKTKENELFELQSEIKRLQQVVNENKIELSKRTESYNTALDSKLREMHAIQEENQSLTNDLNDVKLQLELKVHSLKEKLVDNEILTDKLKSTYECQIDNLNVMITKLSNYLKDKSAELDAVRKEKERVIQTVEENNQAIKALEEELKTETQNQQKLIKDFDSERQILKNMVTVTESIMEDQKVSLNKVISQHVKANEILQEEKHTLLEQLETVKKDFEAKLQEKDTSLECLLKEMAEIRFEKERVEKEINAKIDASEKEQNDLQAKIQEKEAELESAFKELYDKGIRPDKINIATDINKLKSELQTKIEESAKIQEENRNLTTVVEKCKSDILSKQKHNEELTATVTQLQIEINELKKSLQELTETNKNIKCTLIEKIENIKEMEEKATLLHNQIEMLEKDKLILEEQKNALITENKGKESNVLCLESNITTYGEELAMLKIENQNLVKTIEEKRGVISNLEQLLKEAQEKAKKLSEEVNTDKLNFVNKCAILQEYHDKAEIELEERRKEIISTQKELNTLKSKVDLCEEESRAKDAIVSKISKEKDVVIASVIKELQDAKEKHEKEIQEKMTIIQELKQNLEDINNDREALNILRKENEELIKAVGQRETFAVAQSHERVSSHKQSGHTDKELRDLQHQVDNTSSDMSHTSTESLKTISDLEKIILDKNRTITTLNSDVTYLKTLLAESETKLLDITKELELSKENCHQLSTQLKKIVHQKNEEIADLKRQVSKMSVNENRATQIIKVSAKYQAIILKRIAEIKTNTVLKELTNFGNSNSYDTEVKRSLSAGTITMEDLENFLETTDRHLRKCSEKQTALQKERDRLAEVNRIHETEILNLKKLVADQTASFKALSAAREGYVQKMSSVTSLQRTARREILRLESDVSPAALARLERAHAAALQDLAEAALALERWLERGLRRALAAREAPQAPHDAALHVQLDELQQTFTRLLEAAGRARGAGEPADTVAEVRAEYEDKLDRMKSKMKQLYTEQIAVFKEKQRAEIAALERELAKAREQLAQSSRAYEAHIRGLTAELWSVGEKFLLKQDEAEWLRRKQRSGSLMSLQHVHSSGLVPFQEEPSRPSDSHSLRSLPVTHNNGARREGRAMHMSDEEGEVFDNRWLKELSATPRRESGVPGARESGAAVPRESGPPGLRLSELRWRNSLCPPHLKSSYPAETQFTQAVDEEDIKCVGAAAGAKSQRKEVGITAYKKPGPPTPSKQAGRLSATDSELRESLRVEAEPQPSRKTSTPSRIRSLFRSNKKRYRRRNPTKQKAEQHF